MMAARLTDFMTTLRGSARVDLGKGAGSSAIGLLLLVPPRRLRFVTGQQSPPAEHRPAAAEHVAAQVLAKVT
jgi:hypothetical protein